MRKEVAAARLGRLRTNSGSLLIDVEVAVGQNGVDVLTGLENVAVNVHGETRGLRDRKTEVEGDDGGHAAETDDEAPCLVDRLDRVRRVLHATLVGRDNHDRHDSRSYARVRKEAMLKWGNRSTKVAPALESKNGSHDAPTNTRRRKLRRDD